ncbi:MAG: hypothetical protein ACJ746_11895 [Bryobacteraceae bacterium]
MSKLVLAAAALLFPGLTASASILYTFDNPDRPNYAFSFSVLSPDFIPAGTIATFTQFVSCNIASQGGFCGGASITQSANSGLRVTIFEVFTTQLPYTPGNSGQVTSTYGTETPYTLGTWRSNGLVDDGALYRLTISNADASPAPEPPTLSLLALPLVGVVYFARRRHVSFLGSSSGVTRRRRS